MMDRNSTPDIARPSLGEVSSETVANREGNATQQTRSVRPHSSRAVRLLHQLIVRELASSEWLARALSISSQQLDDYRTGCSRMPLHTQRRLAELIISSVPELAREARRLRLQCRAAEAFHAKETETHMVAPPSPFR